MPTERQEIDYGAAPNDGTGDPLRVAFIKTDENFANIWAAGPVGSNVVISNTQIATVNTNGNLILTADGIGIIRTDSTVVPKFNNTSDLGSANLRYRAVYVGTGGANVLGNLTVSGTTTITGDVTFPANVSVGGNLRVQGDIIQVGNIVTDTLTIQLANTAANAGQANGAGITVGASDDIATLLYDAGNNVWNTNIGITSMGALAGTALAVSDATVYGNVDALIGNFTGNVTANSFIGDGSQLTGLPAGYANADAVAYGESGWAGNIIPQGNGVYSLGNSTNYWSNLWVANNTIYIGGVALGVTGNVLTVDGQPVLSSDSDSDITTTGNVTAAIMSADYIQFLDNGSVTESYISETGFIVGSNNSATVATLQAQDVRIITDFNGSGATWTFDASGDLTVPNYIQFAGSTFIGDEPGSGSPTFRIVAPLGYGATIETDSDISGNSWTWTFGSDGVLGAPGNITAPYFIGDGSQLTGLSDGTAIVNGTSQIDIPTANGNIYVGVNNVGSTEFTALGINTLTLAALANITAAGTISATGNLSAGNIYTDGTITAGDINIDGDITGTGSLEIQAAPNGNAYVNLDDISDSYIGAAANLYLLSDSDNRQWIFDTTGTLTAPGDITVAGDITGTAAANTLIVKAQPDSNTYIQLNSIVDSTVSIAATLDIITDSSNTAQNWRFGTDGVLTAPGNVRMGNISASAMSQINTVPNSSGDGNGYTTLELIPDENLTGTDQYLIVDPTAPGHIHIRAGGTQDASSADLFLGGEYSYFRVNSGANAEVQVTSNSNTWVFNTDGNLQVPGNINGNNAAPLVIDGASAGVGYISLPHSTFGGEQIAIVNKFGLGNGIRLETNGGNLFFSDSADLSVSGNIATAQLQNDANLVIRSNAAGTAKNWTFDTLGDFNLPVGGNITGSGGISANNITLTGNISANTAGFAIGYRDIPQVAFTGNATIAAADAGKHFYSTESNNYTLTIADNSVVSWPVGTAVTVVNRGTGNITVAQAAGVSLYLAGNSSAGNRTVSTYGMVTLLNVAANVWMINGTGVA